jgi:hypothetical protein
MDRVENLRKAHAEWIRRGVNPGGAGWCRNGTGRDLDKKCCCGKWVFCVQNPAADWYKS